MLMSWQEEPASTVRYLQLQSDGAVKLADSILVLPNNTSNRNKTIILTQTLIKFSQVKVHKTVFQTPKKSTRTTDCYYKIIFSKLATNVIWI